MTIVDCYSMEGRRLWSVQLDSMDDVGCRRAFETVAAEGDPNVSRIEMSDETIDAINASEPVNQTLADGVWANNSLGLGEMRIWQHLYRAEDEV